MLDGRCAELIADAREHRISFGTRIVPHANLDHFVRVQADVDFMQHRWREPVHTNADNRMQVMRLGAKRAAFAG